MVENAGAAAQGNVFVSMSSWERAGRSRVLSSRLDAAYTARNDQGLRDAMQRSDTRILTTHTGSLPRPTSLVRLYIAKARGEPVDTQLAAAGLAALEDSVRRQHDAGIDIGNNGEQQREAFFLYVRTRMSGFGGAWTRPPRGDVERYPAFKAALDAPTGKQRAGQQPRRRADRDRRHQLSRPCRDRHANAATSAPRSTGSAIRSSSRSSPRRHPASSPPRCATTLPERGGLSRRARRGAAGGIRIHRQPRLPAAARLPRPRDGTAHVLPGQAAAATSSASSIASSPPSTPHSSTSRATACGCTRAGATTKARTTATSSCTRSCRSCAS